WNGAGKCIDSRHRNPCLIGRAGTGRNDNSLRFERRNITDGNLVVTDNFNLCLELAKILHQDVSERIIVVDHQNHDASPTISTALKMALALFMVSFHSSAGTESATTPAPACTYNLPSLITAVRIAIAVSILPFQAI